MEGLTVKTHDERIGTVSTVIEEPQGKPYCEQRRVCVELPDGHVINVAEGRVTVHSGGDGDE